MPWIKRVFRKPKEHIECRKPLIGFHRAGSLWQCGVCGTRWKVSHVVADWGRYRAWERVHVPNLQDLLQPEKPHEGQHVVTSRWDR